MHAVTLQDMEVFFNFAIGLMGMTPSYPHRKFSWILVAIRHFAQQQLLHMHTCTYFMEKVSIYSPKACQQFSFKILLQNHMHLYITQDSGCSM